MVTNLQFAGVAAYLLWCLFSSLSSALTDDSNEAEQNIYESDKTAQSDSAMTHHEPAERNREPYDRAQGAGSTARSSASTSFPVKSRAPATM